MSWDSCFQTAESKPVQLVSHPEPITVSGYRNLTVYHPGYQNLSELFETNYIELKRVE